MYKIETLENEKILLRPHTVNEEEYCFLLHKDSDYYIWDDTAALRDRESFRIKIRSSLNTDTLNWIIWIKKYAIRVGIIYYTHIVPGRLS